jgi:CRP-like cAMP-binding protein
MGSSKVDEVSPSIMPTSSVLSRDPAFIEFARQMLDSSELADGLAPEQMARIAAIGEIRSFEEGQLICDEHEHGDELYIIEAGSVEVWLDPSSIGDDVSEARKIASLQTGQTCGELSLLDGGVRSAQLRAGANGTKLMAFNRRDLLALCEADTAIGYRMMRNLASALALRLRLQDMRLYSNE